MFDTSHQSRHKEVTPYVEYMYISSLVSNATIYKKLSKAYYIIRPATS